MPLPVLLRAVVDEMDTPEGVQPYINRMTGEIVCIFDDDPECPEFDPDESPELLPLPDSFEIDEYEIMERFCSEISDASLRDDLLALIRGSGAFGRFKHAVARHGLRETWFEYRDRSLQRIAADFLDVHGIPYTTEPSSA